MKIFFDTEFEGLHKYAQLISIGLIDENGNQLYIENDDIVPDEQTVWIQENVLNNTILYGKQNIWNIVNDNNDYYVGRNYQLQVRLNKYFEKYDYVELVSDVGHFDMIQLIDIYGDVFNFPKNICPTYIDLNQIIMNKKNISLQEAFDYSREQLLKELGIEIYGSKHNALYDARVIRGIYKNLAK